MQPQSILDTDILSELFKKNSKVRAKAALDDLLCQLALTSPIVSTHPILSMREKKKPGY